MVDRKTFQEIFLLASSKQQYFVDSKYSGEFLYALSQKYSLTEEQDILFCRTVSEIVLGFYKIEDTVPLLQQELGLDPKTAALLGAEVLEFLAPLSDPAWQPPAEESEDEVVESTPTAPVETAAPVNRIPIKAPAFYTESAPAAPVAPAVSSDAAPLPTNPITPAAAPAPLPSFAPAPAPMSAPEPIYRPTEPAIVRPPLSNIPTYTPPPAPAAPVAPAPAPDRPRWSTDI